MSAASRPWNYLNEQYLIGLLEGLDTTFATSAEQGLSKEISNIIIYDEFDINGNLVNGRFIDLNNLDEEESKRLAGFIEKRTGSKATLTKEGIV